VLLITHDRAFLDAWPPASSNSIGAGWVPGQLAAYQTRKAELLANEAVEQPSSTSCWRRKKCGSARAWKRRTRSVARVQRLETMRGGARRRDVQGNVKLEVSQGERSGKIVAELTNVSKAYGDKAVVRDFTATIMRGDKVGLIGPNGAARPRCSADPGRAAARQRHGARAAICRWRTSTRCAPRSTWRSRSPTPSARAATGSRSTASAST
jgi:ATP-binding cassette subfamily F protein uup